MFRQLVIVLVIGLNGNNKGKLLLIGECINTPNNRWKLKSQITPVFIVYEEQASIVRSIFNNYLSGLGISRIAKELDGIKTISGKVKWAESTLRDIIKNEKYVGDALLQKTITKDFKKKRNKGEVPMYYVKDTHPAIITRKHFEQAQKLMTERAKSKGNIEGSREKYLKRYAFTGTIECGLCGKTYKRHLDNCGNVAEAACWICGTYI